MKDKNNTNKEKSYPCVHCGWAMGEREGKPLCDHYKKKRRIK